MKRITALLLALLLPVLAMADGVLYGTLNKRLATRTGPGVEYEEPGTFLQAGDQIPIYSLTYDTNGVQWIQTEVTYKGARMRVYTGMKRVSDVRPADIPEEDRLNIEVRLTRNMKPAYGPGDDYKTYDFTLKAGRKFIILDTENGWAMIDYYAQGDGQQYRFWLPMAALETI